MALDPALFADSEDIMDLDELEVVYDDPSYIEASIESHLPLDDEEETSQLDIPLDPMLLGEPEEDDHAPVASPGPVKDELIVNGIHTPSRSRHVSRRLNSTTRINGRKTTSPDSKRTKGTSSIGKSTSPTTLGKSLSPSAQRSRNSVGSSKHMSPTILLSMSPEEEASLRVAMQLQAEQFGLRSRRRWLVDSSSLSLHPKK